MVLRTYWARFVEYNYTLSALANVTIVAALVANEGPVQVTGSNQLSMAGVFGNISNFIVAGHETTANTLAFIITMLALHPETQSKLHQEIDYIFGSERIKNPDSWSFESDFPRLQHGLMGAIQNETMRLFPLSPATIRKVVSPQTIHFDGKEFVLPPECHCYPNIPATHQNPKYWGGTSVGNNEPGRGTSTSGVSPEYIKRQKIQSWDPMRWLQRADCGDTATENEDSEAMRRIKRVNRDLQGIFGKMIHPRPGTFMPFSHGPRSCIGMRFAQVELCAFMARLFAEHEVRIDTDAYESRQEAVNRTINKITVEATTTLTYKPGKHIKLCLVPRRP